MEPTATAPCPWALRAAMDGENDTLGNQTFLEVQEEIEEEIVSEGCSQIVFAGCGASSTLHFFSARSVQCAHISCLRP